MNKHSLSSWLDKLQQESWNLELLISGFSIFLLLQVGEPLRQLSGHFYELISFSWESGMFAIFLSILIAASNIMIINLLSHVVLRGIWVGMVGLRSVRTIDVVENLGYSQRFSRYLHKEIGSLDDLIIRLDKISSVVFAFTFLIVFMLLSLFVWIVLGSLFALVIVQVPDQVPEWLDITVLILFLLFVTLSFLYLLDTITLGFLKKITWLDKVYLPIYKFLSILTLSFIYRSIYYHLIARLPKGYVRLFLALYVFIIGLYPFHSINYHQFFPDNDSRFQLSSQHYTNQLESAAIIQTGVIPSRMISTRYLPLFIRYHPQYNPEIKKLCTDYTPSKTQAFISGVRISVDGGIYVGSPTVAEESPEKLLNCLSQFYQIYLDTIPLDKQRFYFDRHPHKEERGMTTMILLDSLTNGEHTIRINTRHLVADTIQERTFAYFPFWKE